MKRCPQCEFVYEDDQSLCDMDGILLVFDSQQLPQPSNAGAKRAKPHWRSRLVPALAALVLATVLYLVYYVSTHQQPVRQTYSPATATTPAPPTSAVVPVNEKPDNSAIAVTPKETKKASVPEVKTTKEEKAKTEPAASKVVKEAKEKPKAKPSPKTQNSTSESQEGSKIGSLLKKTGRILKKPFKL